MEVTEKPGKHKSSFVHTTTIISLDNIMDQIPTAIHEKLVAGGCVVRDNLPNCIWPMDRWDRVKAVCGLSEGELSLLMMILCIPNEIRYKLVAGGYVVRDNLPNDMRSMDCWGRVKAVCGLSGGELSRLMIILFIPKEIRDKLVAGGYDLDDLTNDKSMDRWDKVRADCGLSVRELSRLMNALFPVGK
jgi:hypothetical protein